MRTWIDVALIVAVVAWTGEVLLRDPGLAALLDLIGDVAYTSLVIPFLVLHEYGPAVVTVAAVVFVWWWRRRRRGRRRAPRALGEKSRARVAALARRAREAARPRPVLRPAPGGAPG